MKIISFNANGIRAAGRKGFFDWFKQQRADVLCVQELKAQEEQLTDELFNPKGYYRYCSYAEKKGYSGVAIYCKEKPKKVCDDFGWDLAHHEGRYVCADFDNFSVISLYLPSGTSGDHRQAIKEEFMQAFEAHLQNLRRKKREFIICGDWNIVHKEIDIKNWKGNQKNSGCLPHERAWLDKLFGAMQFVDAFRVVNTKPDQYTWWSQRGKARVNNVGWRIDYQVVTPGLKDKIKSAAIHTQDNFSDHAPLILNYDVN
jgi:exodeoxyribonuclease-3